MASYNPAPGPSRASRITLPPMMMMAPSTHQRSLDYEHDLSQASYLRHSYVGPAEYGYDYEFAGPLDYHPNDAYPIRHAPSHPSVEMASPQNNTNGNPPLSLSLLLAAANAAQADSNPYVHSSMHFSTPLSLGCRLDPPGTYSPAVTSPEPPATWPPVRLATSDSDRLGPTPPQTPLNTPEVLYDTSMMGCCRSHSDGPHSQESKWSIERIGSEPAYIHRPSLPPLSCMDYSNSTPVGNHHQELQSCQLSSSQKMPTDAEVFAKSENSEINTPAVLKRKGKRKKVTPQINEKDSRVKVEPPPDSDEFPKAEKPKQGRKKRSVGYVRPIIIHRKRVGQRLLDMLKTAPIPSKPPSMELNRARCFPFADMKNKLKLWYGLQIEWPTDAPFRVEELRSTRRMRLDELERLDKTLDAGGVRLRLSEDVLAEEPHRVNEFSLPSDGHGAEDHSGEQSEDQDEINEATYRKRRRKV